MKLGFILRPSSQGVLIVTSCSGSEKDRAASVCAKQPEPLGLSVMSAEAASCPGYVFSFAVVMVDVAISPGQARLG